MDKAKNKRIMLANVLIMLLTVMLMADIASAQIAQFPQITVTLINQEPDPVAPGNVVEVKFRVENEGSDSSQDMQVKLLTKFPFSMYGVENEIQNIGTVAGYQIGDDGVKVKWNLLVDSNAATGDNEIEFWYKSKDGVWTKSGDYVISVQSREAVLAINQIKTDQENIVPGTVTKVSFMLENLADNTLRDINLNLDIYTELTTTTSITFRELPFTPIGSGNEKTLKMLAPGQSEEISFDLFTDATAESKVHKVPYTLTYYDDAGNDFSREGVVGLLIEGKPELSVNIESTEIYRSGAKGVVEFKLVNKGFSDINFLDLILLESNDFKILSNPEVYIGSLDSDDYETAEYTLLVSKDAEDKVVLPLKVEYRDANGHLYTKEIPLELKLFSGSELKQRTNGSGFPWGLVIIIIILIAIIAWIIYKRKNNKKKKE
ncbi:COG1361 S-layer family protein [Candidatus Woesearchaeota archaeon]|nr:COG1361 S-layer family protein [Candidatus Woesearchaeota archaeon]